MSPLRGLSWEDEVDIDDGDIVENWEEELEETKPSEPVVKQSPKPKPTKAKPPVQEEEVGETEAERKSRLERAVKRSDLQNTMDLFGVDGQEVDVEGVLKEEMSHLSTTFKPKAALSTFYSSDPQSIPEFEKFAEYVAGQLGDRFGDRKNYHAFLECLIRRLMQPRDVVELRKFAGILQDMAVSRQKEVKPVAASSNQPVAAAAAQSKKKKAPVLLATKKGRDLDLTDYGSVEYGDDEY